MDRIDIQKEVHPVDFFAIADQKSGASSEELRTKVEKSPEDTAGEICAGKRSVAVRISTPELHHPDTLSPEETA